MFYTRDDKDNLDKFFHGDLKVVGTSAIGTVVHFRWRKRLIGLISAGGNGDWSV